MYQIEETFSLPENKIRHLTIDDCHNFIITKTIQTIYRVTLKNLDIYAVENISHGHRVVEIVCCNEITDFSPLRVCNKVIITQCKGFLDARPLSGVAELHVTPFEETEPFMSLVGVTHLYLEWISELMELIRTLTSLKGLETVKEMVLSPGFFTVVKEFYEMLIENPQIQKVVIKYSKDNKLKGSRWFNLLKNEQLGNSFEINNDYLSLDW